MSYNSDFLSGYLECALWSSTDESTDAGGEPLDKNYSTNDFGFLALEQAKADCDGFIEANEADLEEIAGAQAGHDFWLTRNGHGAGFWDRGLGEPGERLSAAARAYGSMHLYVGDDGLIHHG